MATIIDIREGCDEETGEPFCTVGNCSNCRALVISQEDYGFPKCCPYCKQALDNGTDDRECLEEIYRTG